MVTWATMYSGQGVISCSIRRSHGEEVEGTERRHLVCCWISVVAVFLNGVFLLRRTRTYMTINADRHRWDSYCETLTEYSDNKESESDAEDTTALHKSTTTALKHPL